MTDRNWQQQLCELWELSNGISPAHFQASQVCKHKKLLGDSSVYNMLQDLKDHIAQPNKESSYYHMNTKSSYCSSGDGGGVA